MNSVILSQQTGGKCKRRTFRWPKEARDMVQEYLQAAQTPSGSAPPSPELKILVTRLGGATGNPRDACLRFVRQMGAGGYQPHKEWTGDDKQRLVELAGRFPLKEVARRMQRSYSSTRSTLHRMGATAQMSKEWFSLYSLAEALHISSDTVQRWVDQGWLKARIIAGEHFRRTIVTSDDFCAFCARHREQLLGRKINQERLEFVRTFVFPPSHAGLLPVRESRKEREAYKEQEESETN